MKRILWLIVCLMTMVVSANAHNVHYPTYEENGITYVKNGSWTIINGVHCDLWNVKKVDKPYDKTIIIPHTITINGKKEVVSAIGENAFSTCISLDSLIISDSVWVNDNAFRGCKQLGYLYYSTNGYRAKNLPNGVCEDFSYEGLSCKTLETHGVCEDSFWRAINKSLEVLIIKNTKKFYNRMDYCQKLQTIICYETEPPLTKCAQSSTTYMSGSCRVGFEPNQWSSITLYVPRESLEKYYFDRVWGEIDNIYAIDEINSKTTSINKTNASFNEKCIYYTLNGTKIYKPTKGIYIKDGKKYLIK